MAAVLTGTVSPRTPDTLHRYRMSQERTKAFSYIRFSTKEQAEGDSLGRQTRMARDYAEAHDLDLDTELTFHGYGESAYKGVNQRSGGSLGHLFRAIELGDIPKGSYLLVENLDRISRQHPTDALPVLTRICDEGSLKVVTLMDERVFDSQTLRDPSGMLFLLTGIEAIRSHQESAYKARRLAAAWAEKRDQARASGKRLTTICPGWIRPRGEVEWEIIPDRAKVVREIFERTLRGDGRRTIVNALNRQEVPVFGRGKAWHDSYVFKILRNPSVIGTYVPHKYEQDLDAPPGEIKQIRVPLEPIPGYFPDIVDEDTFYSVQRLLAARAPRGRHSNSKIVRNAFAGILYCARCRGLMIRVFKGEPWEYLVCSQAKQGRRTCPYRSMRYQVVEATFLEGLEGLLGSMPSGDSGGDLDSAVKNLEGAEFAIIGRLEDIWQEFEDRGPSRTLGEKREALEAELRAIQGELQETRRMAQEATPEAMERRVVGLEAAARTEPLDRGALGRALKEVFKRIEADPETGMFLFQWARGGESVMAVAAPNTRRGKDAE